MHSITEQLVNGLVQAYEEIAKLLADFDLLNKMHYDKDYGAYFDYGNHTEKRVACLMRKVQNNIFKTREEKYWSTISVLEALLNGTVESQR
nr:mannosyl-oligosaccharide glucosidase GCS1 [Tanacetum cinerariifolium]